MAVTVAWPPADRRRGGRESGRGAGRRGGEGDHAAGDRLDESLAVTVHDQRVGEGRVDRRGLAVAAGDRVIVKPWHSKAPMSTAPPRPGMPRWSVVGMPVPLVPASMAGLPGRSGIVWVGPP